ncbi:MAG: hypothetical protein F6J87_18220 [Spirulina sp. SIO3F2]|nr:hypothetical protein [Spirulina sp. SIO3F2]
MFKRSRLREILEQRNIRGSQLFPVSSFTSTSDLATLARQICEGGNVLSICRNGVYRSSLVADSLIAEGINVISEGTHTVLSYEFLIRQLRHPATLPTELGLILGNFEAPLNLLILCVDGDSIDELKEIVAALDWLDYFSESESLQRFDLMVIEGREEDHLYY